MPKSIAEVEHPFRVVKRQFGFTKVRYRGLAKNIAALMSLFALSNLCLVRRRLLAMPPWRTRESGKQEAGTKIGTKPPRFTDQRLLPLRSDAAMLSFSGSCSDHP